MAITHYDYMSVPMNCEGAKLLSARNKETPLTPCPLLPMESRRLK